jgi:hypothetical protein
MSGWSGVAQGMAKIVLLLVIVGRAGCTAKNFQYPTPKEPAPASCPEVDSSDAVVCVDLTDDNREVTSGPARNVIQINRGLIVYVLHPSNFKVSANWAGTQAVSAVARDVPGVQSQDRSIRPDGAAAAPASVMPSETSMSTFRFSPRQAGSVPLTLSWNIVGSDAGSGSMTVELQIESVSFGAVRFGIGTVFGDAVSKSYQLTSFAGSSQSEISLSDNGRMAFEGVLGFAPYIFDVWGCPGHGRSFSGGCNSYVAPYIGFGILGQSATGVQSFDSIFVGGEVAFSSTYSLTVAWVARRKTELATGYSEGSPANVGTPFTRNTSGNGFGLVLNITPDFFSFATPATNNTPPPKTNADGGSS